MRIHRELDLWRLRLERLRAGYRYRKICPMSAKMRQEFLGAIRDAEKAIGKLVIQLIEEDRFVMDDMGGNSAWR
jgi:hypothetical protein